jgi:hypothetical protein
MALIGGDYLISSELGGLALCSGLYPTPINIAVVALEARLSLAPAVSLGYFSIELTIIFNSLFLLTFGL